MLSMFPCEVKAYKTQLSTLAHLMSYYNPGIFNEDDLYPRGPTPIIHHRWSYENSRLKQQTKEDGSDDVHGNWDHGKTASSSPTQAPPKQEEEPQHDIQQEQEHGSTTKFQPNRYHQEAPLSYCAHKPQNPDTAVDPNKAFDPMVRYFCHPEDAQDKMSLSDFYPNFDERGHVDSEYLVPFRGGMENPTAALSSYRCKQPDISTFTNPKDLGLNN
jgi:hypothetical protein